MQRLIVSISTQLKKLTMNIQHLAVHIALVIITGGTDVSALLSKAGKRACEKHCTNPGKSCQKGSHGLWQCKDEIRRIIPMVSSDESLITSFDMNECIDVDCGHGTCNDGINSYDCNCEHGYEGIPCVADINECIDVDCGHGTCNDGINSYDCNCEHGYEGIPCIAGCEEEVLLPEGGKHEVPGEFKTTETVVFNNDVLYGDTIILTSGEIPEPYHMVVVQSDPATINFSAKKLVEISFTVQDSDEVMVLDGTNQILHHENITTPGQETRVTVNTDELIADIIAVRVARLTGDVDIKISDMVLKACYETGKRR